MKHQRTTHQNLAFDPPAAAHGVPAAMGRPEGLYEVPSNEQPGLYDTGAVPGLHQLHALTADPSIEVSRSFSEELLSAAKVIGAFLLRKKTELKHVVSCLTQQGRVAHHILEQRTAKSGQGLSWFNEGHELRGVSLHAAAIEMLTGRNVAAPRLILTLKDTDMPSTGVVVNAPHYETVEQALPTDATGSYEPVGGPESHYYSLFQAPGGEYEEIDSVTAVVGEQPYRVLFPRDHQMYATGVEPTPYADGPAAGGFGLISSANGGGYETVLAASLRAAEADVRARTTSLTQAPAQTLAQVTAPEEGGGSMGGGISRQNRKASTYLGFGNEPPNGGLDIGGGSGDGEVSI